MYLQNVFLQAEVNNRKFVGGNIYADCKLLENEHKITITLNLGGKNLQIKNRLDRLIHRDYVPFGLNELKKFVNFEFDFTFYSNIFAVLWTFFVVQKYNLNYVNQSLIRLTPRSQWHHNGNISTVQNIEFVQLFVTQNLTKTNIHFGYQDLVAQFMDIFIGLDEESSK